MSLQVHNETIYQGVLHIDIHAKSAALHHGTAQWSNKMFYLDTVKSRFQLLSLLMYCGIFFSCLCHLARVFKGLLATEALTEQKALRYVFPIRHMWPPQKKHLQSCSHSAVEKSFQTSLQFYKALNVCRKKMIFLLCVFKSCG